MAPRVSVVIPVYNRAHSVLPTLRSVQEQAFADFECLVIDDGSRDGEALRDLVASLEDPRFRYVRRENGGGGAARNTGIDEAKGAIIAFLDSDDRWLPDKLAIDLEAGADNFVVFSPMLVERAGRIVGERPRRGPRSEEPIGDYVTFGQGFVPSSTIALPTRLARAVGYDGSLLFGDDTDFAIRLGAAEGPFKFTALPRSIMNDDETGDRLPRDLDWQASLRWLERIQPTISRRAFLAYRGWHIARMAAEAGRRGLGVHMYAIGLLQGAFTPSLAAKALAQIFVRRSVWR